MYTSQYKSKQKSPQDLHFQGNRLWADVQQLQLPDSVVEYGP